MSAAAACTLSVGADRQQCATNDDCVGHGLTARAVCIANVCAEPAAAEKDARDDGVALPEDPTWGCVGKVPPLPEEDPTAPVHYVASFSNVISMRPLEGLQVKACLSADFDCAHPVDGTTQYTDANGSVDALLYSGFRGYLDLAPSPSVPNLMPSIAYVLPVPDKNRIGNGATLSWKLLTKDELLYIAGSAGKSVKDEYGHLFFFAHDCQVRAAAGASARAAPITADTYTFYTDPVGTPSLTQATTTASGNGGFINMPAGAVDVTLNREGGQRIGSHRINIRKGTITYLFFGPTP